MEMEATEHLKTPSYTKSVSWHHYPVRSWSVIHSGSVQFSSRYLPCCRPVSGGRCGCLSGGISRLSVRSVVSVCGCGAHPAVHPAVVFHMVLCMFSRITFLHLLCIPCSTGQSCLIQGCDNLRLFRCPKKFAFVGCHQSRMWNPIAVSSESSGLRDV